VSGRPSAATEKALKAIEQKRLNPFAAAKKYGLSPSTLYRALAKKRAE
jgi:transcriptional regulator of acetoin/glycerol metabolism